MIRPLQRHYISVAPNDDVSYLDELLSLSHALLRRWVTYSAGQSNCEGCPVGKYCPNEGTSSPIVCPVGTYRDLKYGSSVTSCKQCPPHKACSTEGSDGQNLQACEAGYYCIFGSTSTRPSKDDQLYDVRKAGPCLPGMYCPQGKVPLPCPRGTVGVAEMQRDVTDCQTCPEGIYYELRMEDTLELYWRRYLLCFILCCVLQSIPFLVHPIALAVPRDPKTKGDIVGLAAPVSQGKYARI